MTPRDASDRELVREVFARTAVPAPARLTRRVRERVASERRRRRPFGGAWQLTMAGGALVGALVTGLLQQGLLAWPSWSTPEPAPSVATLSGDGAGASAFALPPAGEAAGAPRRVTWAGTAAGSFPAEAGAAVSPDGALVAVPDGQGAEVLSAGGRRIMHVGAFDQWSGDGAHVTCALPPGPSLAVVDLRDSAHPRETVRPVTGLDQPDAAWTLSGCAFRAGRAVIVGGDQLAVIDLGSGRVASRVNLGGAPPPVLSPDARYLAENDPEHHTAAISDLVSGSVVGYVTGLVTAFSGDGQLVLTDSELGAPAEASRAALVDWRWDRPVWSASGHATPLAVEPGGQEIAVEVATAAGPPQRLLLDPGRPPLNLDPQPLRSTTRAA